VPGPRRRRACHPRRADGSHRCPRAGGGAGASYWSGRGAWWHWPHRHRLMRRTARQPWALELQPVDRAQPDYSELYASYFNQRGSRRCVEPTPSGSAVCHRYRGVHGSMGCVARNKRRVWGGTPLPQTFMGKSHMFFRPPDSRPWNVAASRFSGSAGAVASSAHCLHPHSPHGPGGLIFPGTGIWELKKLLVV
jgi:hypothetical protein